MVFPCTMGMSESAHGSEFFLSPEILRLPIHVWQSSIIARIACSPFGIFHIYISRLASLHQLQCDLNHAMVAGPMQGAPPFYRIHQASIGTLAEQHACSVSMTSSQGPQQCRAAPFIQ